MIGILKGIIEYTEESNVIVDVNGVGYRVLLPATIIATMTEGDNIKLYTHTHVREDLLELYGFITPEDLKLFQYLISVSGVGCKTALGVFTVGNRKEIMQAIVTNNVTFFSSVPRLGKKNAQKIIIDLKNKVGGGEDIDLSAGEGGQQQEIIAALKIFGFSGSESRAALQALKGKGETVEEKIRLALKYLGK